MVEVSHRIFVFCPIVGIALFEVEDIVTTGH